MKNKKIVITYGTYDMLHEGHTNVLKRAKALGDFLIVGVTSEDYDRSRGKLNVSQTTKERVNAIKALAYVDKVIIERQKKQKTEDVKKYNVDVFAIGDDWAGKFDYLEKYTHVEYLPRTKGISSTELREEKFSSIKLGLVGAGHDASRFLEESEYVQNISPISVYDDNMQRVEDFITDAPIKYGHDSYEEFLSSKIDAVYIASSVKKRYAHIAMALDAGKHVLSENPLALRKNELEELLSLAREKDCLLLPALKTAFLPAFSELLRHLDKGLIGDIKEVRATFTSLYKEKYYPDAFVQQGATNILLGYPSLLIMKVLGKRNSVAFFDQRTREGYDFANRAISTHDNGTLGLATVATGMKSEGAATISGTKGYVYIPAPWWLTKTFYLRFEDPHKSMTFQYEFEGCGLRYMISEFTSLIQRGKIKSKRLTPHDILEVNDIIVEYNDYSERYPQGAVR